MVTIDSLFAILQSKGRCGCLNLNQNSMPILSEEEILANFTDEELRQVGLNMGYKIPQGAKFHAEQSNQKSSE
ncbi:hypothetical protein [Schleiferilactobacillus perolens]|uniref:hypothetical protein n=1 Tax=Schleiferilactobacillus perolens TaxID=100468 RepID=UPI0012EE2911|nr:hypothetical protein [Schleiferilactobacillus perolens]